MLYQAFNSRADIHNDIALYRGTDFNVPHWHGAAELLTVESGTVMLRVDRSEVCVRNGQSALVMPNQLHAFHAEPGAVFWVHVFSGNQVPAFFGWAENRVPKSPVFICKEETRRFYCDACLKANNGAALEPPQDNVQWTRSVEHISPLKLKAVLYAVLADFSEQTEWIARGDRGENELFDRVLHYIQQHYTEPISLESTAAAFGYEPHYFCRCMKRVTGINFRRLVNLYRVERAQRLLETENGTITQVAAQCGFECLRTFNRVFYELSGCTPGEYRRGGARLSVSG